MRGVLLGRPVARIHADSACGECKTPTQIVSKVTATAEIDSDAAVLCGPCLQLAIVRATAPIWRTADARLWPPETPDRLPDEMAAQQYWMSCPN